jgi:hypothetical protein
MIVPLLPLVAAVVIGATFVGITVSMLPRLGNLTQSATTPSAVAPFATGIASGLGLAILALFAVQFLGAVSFYYMMERRNRHFARQQLLFSTLHRHLATKTSASEKVSQLGYLAEDLTYEEHPRSAGIWALLFLIAPITGLIAAYNLTQDLRKHDELQSEYQTTLAQSLAEAGFQQPNFPPYKPRGRDPVLFLVLSAITGGIFWVYWFYALLTDYNGHFSDQAKFEDQILTVLIPPQVEKPCRTCGGAVPSGAKFCPHCGNSQTT